MKLKEQIKFNTFKENEQMLDDFIKTRDSTHERMEELNDRWIYNLQLRKDISTANRNIEIVKKSIYSLIK